MKPCELSLRFHENNFTVSVRFIITTPQTVIPNMVIMPINIIWQDGGRTSWRQLHPSTFWAHFYAVSDTYDVWIIPLIFFKKSAIIFLWWCYYMQVSYTRQIKSVLEFMIWGALDTYGCCVCGQQVVRRGYQGVAKVVIHHKCCVPLAFQSWTCLYNKEHIANRARERPVQRLCLFKLFSSILKDIPLLRLF